MTLAISYSIATIKESMLHRYLTTIKHRSMGRCQTRRASSPGQAGSSNQRPASASTEGKTKRRASQIAEKQNVELVMVWWKQLVQAPGTLCTLMHSQFDFLSETHTELAFSLCSAGCGWWLMLICCEKKLLLTDWWLVLIWCERKILLTDWWSNQQNRVISLS